jgi:hypothetical protein
MLSTLALAEELGPNDVNAIQVVSTLLAEAESTGKVGHFARDLLARQLAEALPNGWPSKLDEPTRFALSVALAGWVAQLPAYRRERGQENAKALLSSAPPAGWRPSGRQDEILLSLFPEE